MSVFCRLKLLNMFLESRMFYPLKSPISTQITRIFFVIKMCMLIAFNRISGYIILNLFFTILSATIYKEPCNKFSSYFKKLKQFYIHK